MNRSSRVGDAPPYLKLNLCVANINQIGITGSRKKYSDRNWETPVCRSCGAILVASCSVYKFCFRSV